MVWMYTYTIGGLYWAAPEYTMQKPKDTIRKHKVFWSTYIYTTNFHTCVVQRCHDRLENVVYLYPHVCLQYSNISWLFILIALLTQLVCTNSCLQSNDHLDQRTVQYIHILCFQRHFYYWKPDSRVQDPGVLDGAQLPKKKFLWSWHPLRRIFVEHVWDNNNLLLLFQLFFCRFIWKILMKSQTHNPIFHFRSFTCRAQVSLFIIRYSFISVLYFMPC